MALSSRLIFTVIGVTLPIAAHLADMSQTHIYNPHWPPHAKFHNGQTSDSPRVSRAVVIDVAYLSAVVVASWLGFRGVR
jgi:hypothetical protein